MNCQKCNHALAPGAKYCTNCGQEVQAGAQASPASSATSPPLPLPIEPHPDRVTASLESAHPASPAPVVTSAAPLLAPTTPHAQAAAAGGFEYAGFWRRLLAIVIDSILVSIVTSPLRSYFPADSQVPTLITAAIGLVYYVGFQHSGMQATLGKKVMGIKVVDVHSGGRVSLVKLIIRELMKYVSAIIIFIGYLMMLWDSKKQTLHDKAADTLVVKT